MVKHSVASPDGARDLGAEESGAAFQKRERITRVATEILFKHGYERANLQEIAEIAGVGKFAIYRFFDNKSDLFKTVILRAAQHISEPLRGMLDRDADVRDNLLALTARYIERLLDPICEGHRYLEIIWLKFPLSLSDPELSAAYGEIFYNNLYLPLESYFRTLVEAGILENEDPRFLANTFIQMTFPTNIASFDLDAALFHEDVETSATRVVDMFLRGAQRRSSI